MSQYLIVNFDKKQYLRPAAFGERNDRETVVTSFQGVMCALVVLLADSNNRGGGDLRSDHPCIGSWAGNRIAIVDEAVVCPELSEPGMETAPLQHQTLTMGTDVSQDAIDAINGGEREWWVVGGLNAGHCLPLPEQRMLPGRGPELLLTAKGRTQPLLYAEDLFNVLGVENGLTPVTRRLQLQKGLDKMTALLGRPERWEVRNLSVESGTKQVPDPYAARKNRAVNGTTALTAELVDTALQEPVTLALNVSFGIQDGTTAAQLYQAVFPGIVFEPRPAITEGVTSPEVLKLLSMIPNLEA